MKPRFVYTVLLVFFAQVAAVAQSEWSLRLPTPSAARMTSLAWGDDQFVALDTSKSVWTSPDGLAWREEGKLRFARKIVSNGERFAAFESDKIWLSEDGATWEEHVTPHPVYDIAWRGDRLVAVGFRLSDETETKLFSTTNGVDWTQTSFCDHLRDLRETGGTIAAFDGAGRVKVSTDGVVWTAAEIHEPVEGDLGMHVVAGGGKFLATRLSNSSTAQPTYLSEDGLTWRMVTEDKTNASGKTVSVPNLGLDRAVGFAEGYFYVRQQGSAFDRGTVYRSADGESWETVTGVPSTLSLSTLISGNGVMMAAQIEPADFTQESLALGLYRSTDGTAWRNVTHNPFLGDVGIWPVYGFGRFFAGGYSSPDGVTWDPSPFAPTHAAGDLLFQMASRFTPNSAPLPDIWHALTTVDVSADGVTSARVDVAISYPRSVTFGAGRYVIVGYDGEIAASTDGLTWAKIASPVTRSLRAVRFLHDRFIAVGEGGTLIQSADGLVWTAESPALLGHLDLQDVAADGATLLIVTDSPELNEPIKSRVVTLGDGTETRLVTGAKFNAVVRFEDRFMATSTADTRSYYFANVLESTDGETWTRSAYGSVSGIARIAAGNHSVVASLPVGRYDPSSYSKVAYVSLRQLTGGATAVAPTITFEAAPRTAARGESATFMVGVTGTGPFTYQWSHGDTPIAGATTSVLTLTGITEADAGNYTVTVSNAQGSATSAPVALTVTDPIPLTITQPPVGGELIHLREFVLSVGVAGSGPVSYQWRRNGVPLTGATQASHSIYAPSYVLNNYIGEYDVVVTAPYSTVTSVPVTVSSGVPSLTFVPAGIRTLAWGDTLQLEVAAEGVAPFSYAWSRTGGPNFTVNSPRLVLPFVTPADGGPYRVIVTDARGNSAEAYVVVSVSVPAGSPVPEVGRVVASPGQTLTLRVPVNPSESVSIQWRKDGVAINGATGQTLNLVNLTAADAGHYDAMVVSNQTTQSIRGAIDVSLASARLSNLSTRAYSGPGEDALVLGFVTAGTSSQAGDAFLLRGVGPGLAALGVASTLVDPAISLLRPAAGETGPQFLATNDDWTVSTDAALTVSADLFASRGAFALDPLHADAALAFVPVEAGPFTLVTAEKLQRPGIVLDEIYAPDTDHVSLTNLSARARVGTGDQTLVVGFVITGDVPMRLLVRGVGPGLIPHGVANVVSNPKLVLFDGSGQALHNNDTWGAAHNVADIRTVSTEVGAFTLAADSNDAVMLETLPPGLYTVHLTSVDETSGIGLIELYVAP